ncbi:hypothetical protein K469DRAFT_754221 [Zopfia rhizophila CBS 207.26]|uniref:Uncharacterized protein n=1 Tax=Zopfia rhizophila CBS 207.26 TaxID=1314779 RepID=A0A6A6DK31_9PEZI|nr:hypothetical protein K469DRAFT_754221 [Zopfia rhizophila CBS 207.26]
MSAALIRTSSTTSPYPVLTLRTTVTMPQARYEVDINENDGRYPDDGSYMDAAAIESTADGERGKPLQSQNAARSLLTFLDLSAELRNRIYEFALTPDKEGHLDAAQTVADRDGNSERLRRLSQACDNDSTLPSPYFYLMHVCRQIRAEFRPLYLKQPIRVGFTRVMNYVDTFYPIRPAYIGVADKCIGSIQINVDKVTSVNILPLLTRLYQYHEVSFTFVSKENRLPLVSDLTLLFNKHAASWKDQQYVGKVAFFTGRTYPSEPSRIFEIHFKSYTPGIWGYEPSVGHSKLDGILKDLGLSDLMHLQPRIGIFLGE